MNSPTEFPDLSEGMAQAEAGAPVFLDGTMKVVFDRKVAFYPVDLDDRGEGNDGNGDPRGPARDR